ncbi:MAG: hypothetical protein BAJATHORv1_170007 [Candidatus Thorarchaeota archaeon]|nr:MAG: hypothetical protein BAJATHORv1_170007 [Candidatus Thorarchaeota archaeon]
MSHRLGVGHAQRASSLHLAPGDRLDAGAEDLGLEGAVAEGQPGHRSHRHINIPDLDIGQHAPDPPQADGHEDTGSEPHDRFQDHGGDDKCEVDQQHQERNSAHDLHVEGGEGVEDDVPRDPTQPGDQTQYQGHGKGDDADHDGEAHPFEHKLEGRGVEGACDDEVDHRHTEQQRKQNPPGQIHQFAGPGYHPALSLNRTFTFDGHGTLLC